MSTSARVDANSTRGQNILPTGVSMSLILWAGETKVPQKPVYWLCLFESSTSKRHQRMFSFSLMIASSRSIAVILRCCADSFVSFCLSS
jgi:hypothetical protein